MKNIISLLALFVHFRAWSFWSLYNRIKMTIAERKEIGILTKDHRLTIRQIRDYGCWLASMKISRWMLE